MNKIIIPTVAIAMGAALVGSVSSTLAWYQYSTKAQAAYIGTSVGKSENLEIKTADKIANTDTYVWKTNLGSADVNKLVALNDATDKNIIPITPAFTEENADGVLAANAALPGSFVSGIETGVEKYGGFEHLAAAKNYVQFTLNIRYKKTETDSSYVAKNLKLVDLTITDDSGANGAKLDLYKAVRVHFAAGTGNSASYNLFARDDDNNNAEHAVLVTNTFGNLDTDNDHVLDKAMVYEWDDDANNNVMYGIENSTQSAKNAAYRNDNNKFSHLIGVLPADEEEGLAVTVTIWLEGWQKLSEIPTNNVDITGTDPVSAMWKPETYNNKHFNVGMRFQAEDIPANNP